MGKNAGKNFVNQFKNTRRQAGLASRRPPAGQAGLASRRPLAGLAGSRPFVGQAHVRPGKPAKGQAVGRPLVGPARNYKKLLPGASKNEKNSDQGDK